MIVMFQGTNAEGHNVTGVSAIAAVMSAAKYKRKTLFVQMTGADAKNAEKYLIGKKKEESEIHMEAFHFEDKGIDALIRRAETSKLVKQNFDNACEPLLNYENMLDLASITKKVDFEVNLTVKDIRTLLHHATDIYDNVFLLMNGKNTAIMQELLELCHCYVTCIEQTPEKEPYNRFEGKRELVICTDFETDSKYSAMYLKKMYGCKKLYMLMHNPAYNDACLSGTLLQFVLNNMNCSQEDDNYIFMKHLYNLMEGIMDKEDWSEAIPEPVYTEDEREDDTPEALNADSVFQVENYEVKKGLFRRKKTKTKITLKDKEDNIAETYESVDEDEELFEEVAPLEEAPLEKAAEEKKKPSMLRRKKNTKKVAEKQHEEEKIPGIKTIALPASETLEEWVCPECGEVNTKKFCAECGCVKPLPPEPEIPADDTWVCPECGEVNTKKFCAECGCAKPEEEPTWKCPECGEINTKKFCAECGYRK